MTWVYGFTCAACKRVFEVSGKLLHDKKRTFMYCSPKCYRSTPKHGGTITCETCGREFFVTAARIRQVEARGGAIRFCSVKCYDRTGDKNPFWGKRHSTKTKLNWSSNPTKHKFPSGRNNPNYKRWVYDPHSRSSPYTALRVLRSQVGACERCHWRDEPSVLQAHHKDRNRQNNLRANLELLCPTCHELEHFAKKDGRWRVRKKERKPPPIVYEEL